MKKPSRQNSLSRKSLSQKTLKARLRISGVRLLFIDCVKANALDCVKKLAGFEAFQNKIINTDTCKLTENHAILILDSQFNQETRKEFVITLCKLNPLLIIHPGNNQLTVLSCAMQQLDLFCDLLDIINQENLTTQALNVKIDNTIDLLHFAYQSRSWHAAFLLHRRHPNLLKKFENPYYFNSCFHSHTGESVLHMLACASSMSAEAIAFAKYLCENFPESQIGFSNKLQNTWLHYAAQIGALNYTEALLNEPWRTAAQMLTLINMRNRSGQTALQIALKRNNYSFARYLVTKLPAIKQRWYHFRFAGLRSERSKTPTLPGFLNRL